MKIHMMCIYIYLYIHIHTEVMLQNNVRKASEKDTSAKSRNSSGPHEPETTMLLGGEDTVCGCQRLQPYG